MISFHPEPGDAPRTEEELERDQAGVLLDLIKHMGYVRLVVGDKNATMQSVLDGYAHLKSLGYRRPPQQEIKLLEAAKLILNECGYEEVWSIPLTETDFYRRVALLIGEMEQSSFNFGEWTFVQALMAADNLPPIDDDTPAIFRRHAILNASPSDPVRFLVMGFHDLTEATIAKLLT